MAFFCRALSASVCMLVLYASTASVAQSNVPAPPVERTRAANSPLPTPSLPTPSQLSPAIDPTHLARIDRLIEASGFVSTIETQFASIGWAWADDSQPAKDAEIRRFVLDYARWRHSVGLWRAALASRLTPGDVEVLITYHETDGGRAVVACERRVSEPSMLAMCPMSLDEEERRQHDEFVESLSNRIWVKATREAAAEVLKQAWCLGLEREPAVMVRLIADCRSHRRDVCDLIRRENEHAMPTIDLAQCVGFANGLI
jgi:hypothetical protein